MPYRVRNLVLAVALAALAAMLTTFYVANYKRTVQNAEENVPVFVAVKDIPAGTPGAEAVDTGLLEKVEIPRRSVVPGAISSPREVESLVSSGTIYEGEQVTARRFVTVEKTGIRSELKGNLRAVQISGDANQLLAGTLKKGDRVDVVGTWNVPENETHHVSRVVLRDLLVLKAADVAYAAEKVGGPMAPASVQLRLTDSQASKLEWIVENGKWRLQLRPPQDAEDSAENVENFHSLLVDGIAPGVAEKRLGRAEGSN